LLRSGTVDGIDNLYADDIPVLSADPNFLVLSRDPIAINYLGVNTTLAPLNDVRVRKAIAMSISSERLVQNFYPAGSTPATHFVPCVIRYGCEGSDWYSVDQDSARALLSEAGYADGLTIPLYYRSAANINTPDPLGIVTDVQAQLAEIGITVELKELESTTFSALASAGELDGLFLGGWIADFIDPINYFYRNLVSSPERFGGRIEAIAGPLEKAAATENSPERAALFAEANEAMSEAAIIIPLGHASSALAWSNTVIGANSSPVGFEDFSLVSIPGKESVTFITIEEPPSLYCADEVTPNTLRYCYNIFETLYKIDSGSAESVPSLAESCLPSKDLRVWTCELRQNVFFHNGAKFDAGDVRDSYAAQWDCALATHFGRTGSFDNWGFISDFLHPEACVSE
jgi:ABC-type transport system substrate-binding protein